MKALTLEKARERVAKGVELLNKVKRGWKRKIDKKKLKMDVCSNCIIGQLFGDYIDGVRKIRDKCNFSYNTQEYGFSFINDPKSTHRNWRILKRAWLEVLEK